MVEEMFSYLLECSLLNAYVLHGLAYPHLHQAKGRKKIDFAIPAGGGHFTDMWFLLKAKGCQPRRWTWPLAYKSGKQT